MQVLVIGGGGREHALAWKAAQSAAVETVFVAPGNAGTALEPKLENLAIEATDIPALLAFAKQQQIALTIVGPEAPLVLGVVDAFRAEGLNIFGPTEAAAQLEGSKAFTKDFLARHRIPTADYQNFTEIAPAKAYVAELAGRTGFPVVIKADGLAAGKGVIIAQDQTEADAAIDDMLAGNKFGEAGSRVVVEEFLRGEEASFIVMVDGNNILPMATSQDHKARDNADNGPNTGGMGAYSPAPVVTQTVHDWVMANVIRPTVDGMAAEGNVYTGFLYAGLMIAADGSAKVLEYNCRFGDPETQPIMMRLKSDLVELCLAACRGELDKVSAEYDQRAAVGVVMAAGGYPDDYRKGDVIEGLSLGNNEAKVFHAGTKMVDGHVVTNGGRVLCATALGNTVTEAQQAAYALVDEVHWDDVYFRTDIGYRAIAREQA
ncbi:MULTISPECIES: phosphoribosylamine--glycine ligase [Shewanella]|uniref:Phosphoribosylamine--glycine ligase n=3 Tax=Shewanella TaxID=22 RepID=A0ABU4Q8M6_9GAMM|nr:MULTISPECIES: phosphoribosylamine--glycine ligase [Shewanella]BCV38371.1 phosphoribosylamine--glycine ligase [Shewanella chilikensis]MBO2566911.1 phosphoribosylamine--glycine ligase [Shewanella algae]MBO2571113.1 phosphoribosylamine--glycine ligase [Shewanella algae]MBO2698083.1 phosphoribosylamine--glycine ligase [Shewanella algae]MBO2702401.1 phosphoribosylamine--glycine ligase [Shewanella algae]